MSYYRVYCYFDDLWKVMGGRGWGYDGWINTIKYGVIKSFLDDLITQNVNDRSL